MGPILTQKILIVDDDSDFRGLLRRRLQSQNWVVEMASDTAEAIMLTKRFNPALVILDMSMPAGGGPEGGGRRILEFLEFSDKTSKIPVVVISGWPKEKLRDLLEHNPSVKAIMTKPYDADDLQITIKKLLTDSEIMV
jgi:CheY-like chemotaxis protein